MLKVKLLENQFPTLEVIKDDGVKGYLTPFRGYRFQVSKTVDGEWDLGSSPVVGLGNIFKSYNFVPKEEKKGPASLYASNSSEHLVHQIFRAYAIIALLNFAKTELVDDDVAFTKFINNSVEYIKTSCSK